MYDGERAPLWPAELISQQASYETCHTDPCITRFWTRQGPLPSIMFAYRRLLVRIDSTSDMSHFADR